MVFLEKSVFSGVLALAYGCMASVGLVYYVADVSVVAKAEAAGTLNQLCFFLRLKPFYLIILFVLARYIVLGSFIFPWLLLDLLFFEHVSVFVRR